jgi:Electron transfer DM13
LILYGVDLKLRLCDSYAPITRKYNGDDITIKLPGDLTVYDIKWLSMWCVKYSVEFGHVDIPKDLNVPPYFGKKMPVSSNIVHIFK